MQLTLEEFSALFNLEARESGSTNTRHFYYLNVDSNGSLVACLWFADRIKELYSNYDVLSIHASSKLPILVKKNEVRTTD